MSLTKLQVGLRFASDGPVRPMGMLGQDGRNLYFTYDDAFLAGGLHPSPFRLPCKPGLLAFDHGGRMETFGVFEDAMPDAWGRRLMDRHFQKKLGRTPTAMERLAYLGEHAMGALVFHPAEDESAKAKETLDLAALAQNAWRVHDGAVEEALPELLAAGGSSGGARPKALIGLPAAGSKATGVRRGEGSLPEGWEHWLVKFDARGDGRDAGALEYAYAEMAAQAGAEVAPRRLVETRAGTFFATRRFDRLARTARLHMHTAAGLLHADFRTPGDEYEVLFRLVAALTRDHAQAKELFRRAALNVLACNRDDHLKNFSFLMDRRGQWRLSPFYDFTLNEGPGGWHTLTVAGNGQNPGLDDLRRLAVQAQLRPKEAEEILDAVRGAVAQLPKIAQAAGVSAKTVKAVAARLGRMG